MAACLARLPTEEREKCGACSLSSTAISMRVQSAQEDNGSHEPGPAVVHCSAGIGRTGTFCALDIALRRLRSLPPDDAAGAVDAVKVREIHGGLQDVGVDTGSW